MAAQHKANLISDLFKLQKLNTRMKNILLLALSVISCTTTLQAQDISVSAQKEIENNKFLSASNHLDYDNYPATAQLTPAPKDYTPFYMSHYGRHGSRWLLSDGEYSGVINTLKKARQNHKLTPLGQETLQKLEQFYPCTIDRWGDLTTVGERQHHGIGKRMTEHFPEIFKTKNILIDARSTVVPRCILSMTAECEELAAFNPSARIHNDVSNSLQYYLNQPWSGAVAAQGGKGWDIVDHYKRTYTHPDRITSILFNDPTYVKDSINAGSFMRHLFKVANNMQSHTQGADLYSLFTPEECYDQWRIENVSWYLHYGPSPVTQSVMPFSQLNLLKNIIETADTVHQIQATLRFGHEVCVMPLACLLELGHSGDIVQNLDTLDRTWRNYNIFPMGCNVQLIFYRPKKNKSGEILVKALLNEREVSLPVPTTTYPYYSWTKLRQYYLDKIRAFENK